MIPQDFLEEIYAISIREDACRIGNFQCRHACEPHTDNHHGENLLTLPGEWEFITKRLKETPRWNRSKIENVEIGFVMPSHTCPYYEEVVAGNDTVRKCSIYEHRPIRCRTYPLLVTRMQPEGFRLWSAKQCPKALRHIKRLEDNDHYNTWVAVWSGLDKYVPAWWWKKSAKLLPEGMLHIADLLQPKQLAPDKVPSASAVTMAHSSCGTCYGKGFVTINGKEQLCRCVESALKRFSKPEFALHVKE